MTRRIRRHPFTANPATMWQPARNKLICKRNGTGSDSAEIEPPASIDRMRLKVHIAVPRFDCGTTAHAVHITAVRCAACHTRPRHSVAEGEAHSESAAGPRQ